MTNKFTKIFAFLFVLMAGVFFLLGSAEKTVVLNKPYNFVASFTDNERVYLSWGDASDGEMGYRVYRDGNLIATLGTDIIFYSDTEIEFDKIYEYQVSVFDDLLEEKGLKTFVLTEKSLGYNESKLISLDNDNVGKKVINQSWIYSIVLSESELKVIAERYPSLNIIGYSDIEGLLVEYNEESYESHKSLEEIRFIDKIVSVENRVLLFNLNPELSYKPNDYDITLEVEGINNTVKESWNTENPFGANWHLEYMNLPEIWDLTKGSNDISIGICDGGFNLLHEDLKGRGNIIYAIGSYLDEDDKDIHGNAVLGIIGATQNNNVGIAGINQNTPIYISAVERVYEEIDLIGSQTKCFSEIQKLYRMKKYNKELSVANVSLGVNGKDSNGVYWSITYAKQFANMHLKTANKYNNTLWVFAAGNEAINTKNSYPGIVKKDNIIYVAAQLKDNYLVNYSNYGKGIDIAAPTHIMAPYDDNNKYYTTVNKADYGKNNEWLNINPFNNKIGFGGTSASAPMVTGIASLMISLKPDLAPSEVKNIMINTSTEDAIKRYTKTDSNSEDDTVAISPIPILNAKRAIDFVKDLTDGNAYIIRNYNISDHAVAKVEFTIDGSIINGSNVSYTLNQKVNGNWQKIANARTTQINSNSFEITLLNELPNKSEDIKKNQSYRIHATVDGKKVLAYEFDVMVLQITGMSFSPLLISNTLYNLKLSDVYGSNAPIVINTYNTNQKLYLKPKHYSIYAHLNTNPDKHSNGQKLTTFKIGELTKKLLYFTEIRQGKLGVPIKVINKSGTGLSSIPLKLASIDNSISTQLSVTGSEGRAFITIDAIEDFYNLFVTQNGIERLIKDKIVLFNDKLRELTIVLDDNITTVIGFSKVLKTGQTKCYDYDTDDEEVCTEEHKGQDGYYATIKNIGVERSYTRDDVNEIVTDNATGLIWQDNEEAKTITKTWEEAKTYCENFSLSEIWRLPTIKELQTLPDLGKFDPAIDSVFKNVISDAYWSSTTGAFNDIYAWFVGFSEGASLHYTKSGNNYNVRCVRLEE